MSNEQAIKRAQEHLGKLLSQQIERIERIKQVRGFKDYQAQDRIVIGLVGGDGIGPAITKVAEDVIRSLLSSEVASGKIQFKEIKGLTIENRVAQEAAIPSDVLREIKGCDVILKGPTTTPEKGDGMPNIESANVRMRKELDLFANVRPVVVPEKSINWTFFRENTEGLYALGSSGLDVTSDFSFDFRVISTPGAERIVRAAFEYAKRNAKTKVTVVTKANVVKRTDGRFLDVATRVAADYPGIEMDSWYIDIMTANLIDPLRQAQFEVLVMPNLYGDILTDEAAQIQGGVGTAGAANIGYQHAMFEAIHGSAPRMVREKRDQFANPSSMLKAAAMLMDHIGYTELERRLSMALEVCGQYERRLKVTGHDNGATGLEYGRYVAETVARDDLEKLWRSHSGTANG